MARRVPRLLLAFTLAVLCLGAAYAEDLPLDTVLIRDGDVEVTVADFEAAMMRIPEARRAQARASEDTVSNVIDSVFITRMLALQARERGLADDPVTAARVQQQGEQILSRLRLEELRENLDREDAEQLARERYQADRSEYRLGERVRAQHILIATQERSEDEARELATELVARLRENPDEFAEVASEHSDDSQTAEDAGLIGMFGKGRMVESFQEAAFSLEPGRISDPVKTRFGYHIIRVQEKLPARQQDFAEVRDKLVEEVLNNKMKALRQELMQEIREQPTAAVNWEAVDRLVEQGKESTDGS